VGSAVDGLDGFKIDGQIAKVLDGIAECVGGEAIHVFDAVENTKVKHLDVNKDRVVGLHVTPSVMGTVEELDHLVNNFGIGWDVDENGSIGEIDSVLICVSRPWALDCGNVTL
jgi:hypothetical protein